MARFVAQMPAFHYYNGNGAWIGIGNARATSPKSRQEKGGRSSPPVARIVMIVGNERLIIVVGMAHSGTTILTYLLRQHPDAVCCTDGTEAWVLENTWLPFERQAPIQDLLARFPHKRVLLKRPWNVAKHRQWMENEMPSAKYLYCFRGFEDISKSWSKPKSFVDPRLRAGDQSYQRETYDMCCVQWRLSETACDISG